ncbi:hypothetical protein [Xanthomonas sp. MUS 060]|uniref:hypothetical protein n=1 Tax=Xanthomonas sp. MUS 060 TaxID=1588031 RepID=UPI001F299CF8|nr:hypothetical protein [Xanthomonas sp. MUS 060]
MPIRRRGCIALAIWGVGVPMARWSLWDATTIRSRFVVSASNELGEIEARLSAHADVRESVVVALEDATGSEGCHG